ncbi:hypothetical protein F7734_50555 [Scytonema sp. UIC 10036]|uniref:hypothetical protein n=1 Tax=Scytonema sp. UIC 10036 TaxID=2304196 RepID=UPI0012DA65DD|nr:hypothetical protein [Scytonema sp. UIC 10036]MUH00084.1 hypothetical protein [Scytonema sp. UIC 10036]
MSKSYKSLRLSLSYPAVEKIKQMYSLPADASTHAIASYLEKLVFETQVSNQMRDQ